MPLLKPSAPSFGVTVMGSMPPADFVAIAKQAEELGYDYLWVTDSSLHAYYVYPYLTLAAVNTSRIRLGTNCTHPLTTHPAVTMNAIATVNAISAGRAILGIGSGGGPVIELGETRSGAKVKDVETMVTIGRRLLAGERLDYEGPEFVLQGARLHGLGEFEPPKIYVTASGPRMLEMAGRVADGVLMCCGASREGLEFALSHVRKGAEEAHRDIDEIDLAWHVFGTFDRDLAKAHRLGQRIAWLANWFPAYCALAGIPEQRVAEIKNAYAGVVHFTEPAAEVAAALVTDEMVAKLTVSGDADRWHEFLSVAQDAGISHIELFSLENDVSSVLRGLASEVLASSRGTA